MKKFAKTFFTAACMAALMSGSASAQDKARTDNVVAAGRALGEMEKGKGLGAAFADMRGCYEKELPYSHIFTLPLQQCVTKDMIISRIVAEFSKTLNDEARKSNELPDAESAINAMQERVIGVFSRMRVTPDDAKIFTELVRVQGMDAYGRARYPERYK